MSIKTKLCACAGLIGFALSYNAAACSGYFYVNWIEGEGSTQAYVRSTLVHSPGTLDKFGIMTIADSALGGTNNIYIYDLMKQAFVDNTKLFITTDDTDCVINNDGEDLGIISDVQAAND